MNKIGKERFIGLEWLRFLLGMYVVVYHTLHVYPAEQKFRGLDELTSLGFFATSTFFVLSGFLLAHVYVTDGQLRESPRSFLTKRFSNLYPIHIFSILLTIGVLLLISQLGIGPDLDQATPRFVVYDTHERLGQSHPELFRHWMSDRELLLNSILQLTMLQAWNPLYLTFNAPLWSLSTLFFFYLCFPALAPRLMRIVQGVTGRVPMRMRLRLRPDYGAITPWVERAPDGVMAVAGPDAFRLSSPVPLDTEDASITAEFSVSAGASTRFTLGWWPSHEPSPPVGRVGAHDALPDGVTVETDPPTGDIHLVAGPHFRGVQFHAESILTEDGVDILRDLLRELLGPGA